MFFFDKADLTNLINCTDIGMPGLMSSTNDPTKLIFLETTTSPSKFTCSRSKFYHLRLTTVPFKVEKVVPIEKAYRDGSNPSSAISNIQFHCQDTTALFVR